MSPRSTIITGVLAALVAACGGGGGGGVSSTPAAPLAPPPPPPPPPPAGGTPSAAPFGLTADAQFPTVGDALDIRWNAGVGVYEVRMPDKDWERLSIGYSSAKFDEHYPASGAYGLRIEKDLPYQHTKLGSLLENAWGGVTGRLAFGMPTAAGDVPTTGSASYTANLWGTGTGAGAVPGSGTYYEVTGTAKLSFDFGAGILAGHMQPKLTGPTGAFDTPRYDFAQTLFAAGSRTFSGSFAVPGSTASSQFSGQFTGPQAAELMASWRAPFADPTAPNGPAWGTMSGLWIGKKD